MNKQAVTFFSLFSLILVLAIYYVLIPPNISTETVNTEATLQAKLDAKREEQQQIQNDILASSISSGIEMNEAIETIEQNNTHQSVEARIKEALEQLGYQDVFCEIENDIIKVTITKNNATNTDALDVMTCIEKTCQEKYSPEIKFIDE